MTSETITILKCPHSKLLAGFWSGEWRNWASLPHYLHITLDLIIFEVFLNLDDTIDNNNDKVQEAEKDKLDTNIEICRDSGRLWLFFSIMQNASYNLWLVIFYKFPVEPILARCSAWSIWKLNCTHFK